MRFKLLSCAVGLALLGSQVAAQANGTDPVASAVRAADVVVVAKVVGMVDAKARVANKVREAHWVRVEKSLKSYDLAGQMLRVRPNGNEWRDGANYVLFLKDHGNGFFDAARTVVPTSAESLRRIVEVSGGAKAKLQLRMVEKGCGCCGAGNATTFALTVDGKFEFKVVKQHKVTQTLVGKLSATDAKALITRISTTKVGPMADCGGTAMFAFAGKKGALAYRAHSLTAPARGADLVTEVTAIANKYGVTAKIGATDRR